MALREVLARDFAVVLLDVQMPGMDGFETAQFMKRRHRSRSTPIIFLTASPQSPWQLFQGYSAGAVDYLCKPVPPDVLRAKVRVFLDLFEKNALVRRQAERLLEVEKRDLERRLEEEKRAWQLERLREEKEKQEQLAAELANQTGQLLALNARLEDQLEELRRAEERLRAALNEKEILLRELHHRVNNNLQVISSFLQLQARAVADPRARDLLREGQSRVRSMALVHEKLYRSGDLARIDVADYVRSLAEHTLRSFGRDESAVRLSVDIADVRLGIDTIIPCALIINELLTNALKYAFPDGRHGELRIALEATGDDSFRLTVRDDGVGFPKHMDFRAARSLGLQIVNALAEQLDGSVELVNGTGTTFIVSFREIKYRERR